MLQSSISPHPPSIHSWVPFWLPSWVRSQAPTWALDWPLASALASGARAWAWCWQARVSAQAGLARAPVTEAGGADVSRGGRPPGDEVVDGCEPA